jgi:hypothetical protein
MKTDGLELWDATYLALLAVGDVLTPNSAGFKRISANWHTSANGAAKPFQAIFYMLLLRTRVMAAALTLQRKANARCIDSSPSKWLSALRVSLARLARS